MQRRERSDKKKSINPTVSLELYDTVCRLAYVCTGSVKDVGHTIISLGLSSQQVIESLSSNFRRPYFFDDNVMFNGHANQPKYNPVVGPSQKRMSLRFYNFEYDKLTELAYAMDSNRSKATAAVLETSLCNQHVLSDTLARYVQRKFDEKRLQQLNQVLQFINASSPNEDVTLSGMIGYLFSRVGQKTKKITQVVTDWMDSLDAVD